MALLARPSALGLPTLSRGAGERERSEQEDGKTGSQRGAPGNLPLPVFPSSCSTPLPPARVGRDESTRRRLYLLLERPERVAAVEVEPPGDRVRVPLGHHAGQRVGEP